MSENLKLTKQIKEEIEFAFMGTGPLAERYNPLSAASSGMLWSPMKGIGANDGFWAYWFWLCTRYFNRLQRYGSRVCYMQNCYAETLINNLVMLVLGEGFKYSTQNKSEQDKLKKWLKDTKWIKNAASYYRDYLVDGENFLEIGEYEGKSWCRRIDPDFVYSSTNEDDRDMGVISAQDDYEEIVSYQVHDGLNDPEGRTVSAATMQHRANKKFGSKRGFSILLNIISDLNTADKLTNSLGRTAEVVAKFAFFRKHKANQGSVQTFRGNIKANNPYPLGQNGTPEIEPTDNIERYEDGSIIDQPDTIDIVFPEGYSAEGFVLVLDSILRKVASKCNQHAATFNLRDSNESYNASLVRNSLIVRAIQSIQCEVIEYDKELLEKAGFDIESLSIVAPEVNVVSVEDLLKQQAFLMGENPQGAILVSNNTVQKSFGIDSDSEKEQIKNQTTTINTFNGNDTENNRTSLPGESNARQGEKDSQKLPDMRAEV